MARKAKPPPSTLVFSAAEFAPLHEAFARAEGALGSGDLAGDDLTEHLRSGRLPAAMYRRSTFERIEPTFWKSLRVVNTDYLRVLGLAEEIASSAPHFFVARAPLDKLYSTDPTPSEALAEPPGSGPGRPMRRKPGPQPIKDWPTVVARELIRRAKAGEKEPTAIKMIEFCEGEIGYSPVLREMQKLLEKLR